MPDRRSFLSRLLAATAAVVAAPFVYVAGRFLGPVRSTPGTTVVRGDQLPDVGGVLHVKLGTSDAVLVRNADGALVAFSLTCTHTGCTVNWRPERRVFHCPCHNGLFAVDGGVISGPPKRPLVRLTTERLPGGAIRITDVAA